MKPATIHLFVYSAIFLLMFSIMPTPETEAVESTTTDSLSSDEQLLEQLRLEAWDHLPEDLRREFVEVFQDKIPDDLLLDLAAGIDESLEEPLISATTTPDLAAWVPIAYDTIMQELLPDPWESEQDLERILERPAVTATTIKANTLELLEHLSVPDADRYLEEDSWDQFLEEAAHHVLESEPAEQLIAFLRGEAEEFPIGPAPTSQSGLGDDCGGVTWRYLGENSDLYSLACLIWAVLGLVLLLVLLPVALVLLVVGIASAILFPPNPPDRPTLTGPSSGFNQIGYTFRATSTHPTGDSLRYRFDWGDVEVSDTLTGWYPAGSSTRAEVTWPTPGVKLVRVQAEDTQGRTSDWAEMTVIIAAQSPNTPLSPLGPASVYAGLPYNYTTTTTDPGRAPVTFLFDWGDGTVAAAASMGSGEPVEATHTWAEPGTYMVRVQARNVYGAESSWSQTQRVTVALPGPGAVLPENEHRDACGDLTRQLEDSVSEDDLEELRAALECPDPIEQLRLPPYWLDTHELIQRTGGVSSTPNHDWDGDGVPDLFDAVNLPSEAQMMVGSGDELDLPQGLDIGGFLLLLDPSHKNAYFVVAELTASPPQEVTGEDALDWIEAAYGVEGHNTFSRLFHEDITVHMQAVLPNTPLLGQSLPWPAGSLAVDGTWLLVRSDGTRGIDLSLGGERAPVIPPLASQLTNLETHLRWEFLNVHRDSAFCYDGTMLTGASPCTGNPDPGWIRAYSGLAAYTLGAVEAALHHGLIDFGLPTTLERALSQVLEELPEEEEQTQETGDPLEFITTTTSLWDEASTTSTDDDLEPLPSGPTIPSFRVPEPIGLHDPFDADSPWRIPGDGSRKFPHGVGVNYLFDLDGLAPGSPFVKQARSLEDPSIPDTLRQFHFEGHYVRIPGTPQDLRHLAIGIEAVDGNHGGQAFVLDGKALAELLPLDGYEPVVEISEDGEEGFAYRVEDVNGNGYDDVIVWIPHFSQKWIRVGSTQVGTNVQLMDVKVTGPDHAWISGSDGAVYEFTRDANGNVNLVRHAISVGSDAVSSDQQVYGIHLLGPTEFFVVGEGNCDDKQSFIAHYNNGWESLSWQGSQCSALIDIWMNPTKTRGFVGGEEILMLEYTGVTWRATQASGRPGASCDVRNIEFNDQGRGYTALANPSCNSQNPVSSIMYFDGTSFSPQGLNGDPPMHDVMDATGKWAVGLKDRSSDPGIYQQTRSSDSWKQVSSSHAYAFFGISDMPGSSTIWAVGRDGTNAVILRTTGGSWSNFNIDSSLPSTSVLNGVDLLDQRFGVAVGYGTVLMFDGNKPPVVVGSVNRGVATTQQTVTGDGSGSWDPDGPNSALEYEWDWGDGSYSSSKVSTHRYNDPGTYDVWLTVSDSFDDSTKFIRRVTVNPESISLGSEREGIFSGSVMQRAHFQVSNSNGKSIEASVDSCEAGVKLLGRVGSAVQESAASTHWGHGSHASDQLLAGEVSGGNLFLAVEKPEGVLSNSCSLKVKTIAKPNTPVITSLPSPTSFPVVLQAQAGHPDGYNTQLKIQWGDHLLRYTTYASAGTTHSMASPAGLGSSFTVKVWAIDTLGQESSSVSKTVSIRTDPSASANTPIGVQDDRATLRGQVNSMGGASSVDVRYLLYQGSRAAGTPIDSEEFAEFEGSTLPSWTATGLTAGVRYSYVVEVENEVFSSRSNVRSFQTDTTTSIMPRFTSTPSSSNTAGNDLTLSLRPTSNAQNVAYFVTWGDGTVSRYPSTGYNSPSSTTTATHNYGLPYGAVTVSVQLETSAGGRSGSLDHSLTVTGGSPVQQLSHSRQAEGVTLWGNLNNNVVDVGSTDLRFKYHDGSQWRFSSWFTGLGKESNFGSWSTSPNMAYNATYPIYVELKTGAGTVWTAPQTINVVTNRLPELTSLDTGGTYSYMDLVKFAVQYRDDEGDPPDEIEVVVNGESYPMHPSPKPRNYKDGVTYHYVLRGEELGAPGTYRPTYVADDGKSLHPVSEEGNVVTVKQGSLGGFDFESDPVGGTPAGFTKSREHLNYWRVADTTEGSFPDMAALGGTGNALWFGKPPQGTYHDPNGGIPRGSVFTQEYDLSTVMNPVLSFSSYYETADLTNTNGKKTVRVNYKDPGATNWNVERYVLMDISGFEGGFKKWQTQAISLEAYKDQVVQFEFRFDAVDNRNNAHLGWLVSNIYVGTDSDGDTLSDDLERNRFVPLRAQMPSPVRIQPGEEHAGVLYNVALPGAENLLMDTVISTNNPDNLVIDLVAHPDWAFNGIPGAPAENLIFSMDGGTVSWAGCGFGLLWSSPVKPWQQALGYPIGPPFGMPNLEPDVTFQDTGEIRYEASSDGVRLQLDLVKCLQAAGAPVLDGHLPMDLALRVTNNGNHVAWIDSFSLMGTGRTSAFNWDSDGSGIGDRDAERVRVVQEGSGTITSPLGWDMDRDGVPTELDVDDRIPQLINTMYVDFSEVHAARLTFWVAPEVGVMHASIHSASPTRESRSNEISPNRFDGQWQGWRVNITNLHPDNHVIARFTDLYGAVTELRLHRSDGAFEGIEFKWSYNGEYELNVEWPVQVFEGSDPIIVALAPPEVAWKVLDAALLVDDAISLLARSRGMWVIGATSMAYTVARPGLESFANMAIFEMDAGSDSIAVKDGPQSEFVIRAPWRDCQGIDRKSIVFFDFLSWYEDVSTIQARAFLESGPDSVPAAYHSCRWFQEDSNGLLMLEGKGNIVTSGKQVPTWSWGQLATRGHEASDFEAARELFSTERHLADAVYGMSGYQGLACHLSCYGQGESAGSTQVPEGVDSWLSAWESSGSNRERRELQSVGMMNALRFSEWGLSGAQAPWDLQFAENVMGLQSVLYTYRLARDTSDGRGADFDDYWGDRDADPGCFSSSERRCRSMTLGDKLGGSGDPFEVLFHLAGQSVLVDTVVVHGHHVQPFELHSGDRGLSTVHWGVRQGLGVLDDSGSSRGGIAVGLSHDYLQSSPSLNVVAERGNFLHGYRGSP